MITEMLERAWDTEDWSERCFSLSGVTPIVGAVVFGWSWPDVRALSLVALATVFLTVWFYRKGRELREEYWQARQTLDER